MTTLSRALAVSLLLSVGSSSAAGCGSSKEGGTSREGGTASDKPAVEKPIAQVTKEDLEAALTKLGYKPSGTTWNDGKEVSNFMVTGSKEDARGKKAPDGKSRISVTASIFTVVPAVKDRELARLSKDGATRVDGNRIVAVKVFPAGTEDPAAVMKQLFGG
jgi:hypothetical protein